MPPPPSLCSPVPGVMVHHYQQVHNRRQQHQLPHGITSGTSLRPQQDAARSSVAAADGRRGRALDAAALQRRLTTGLNLHMPSNSATLSLIRARQQQMLLESQGVEDWSAFDIDGPVTAACSSRIPTPSCTLSASEWSEIERRAEERGDVTQPCPICQEHFKDGEQIILSCSHIFHRACIMAFERFVRATQRTCPICRKSNYDKLITRRGTTAYTCLAATKIQSRVRGFLVRRQYRKLLKIWFRQGGGDPERRKRFALEELTRYTEGLTKAMEVERDSIDTLFAECETALAISRNVFRKEPTGQQSRHRHGSMMGEGGKIVISEEGWCQAIMQAQIRQDKECPICMAEWSTGHGGDTDDGVDYWPPAGGGEASGSSNKAVVILPCSHLYHETCLAAFESFNINFGGITLCPLCRCEYQEKAPFY